MANRTKPKSKEPADGPGNPKFEKEIKDLFKLFDKDGDKSLSLDELGKAMKGLGICMSYKEIQLAMKDIDKNGNGKVEFKEFRQFIISHHKQSDLETQARESFKIFDRDGNGAIDRRELKHAMKMLGEDLTDAEVEQMMGEADENKDGKINFEEFLKLWRLLNPDD